MKIKFVISTKLVFSAFLLIGTLGTQSDAFAEDETNPCDHIDYIDGIGWVVDDHANQSSVICNPAAGIFPTPCQPFLECLLDQVRLARAWNKILNSAIAIGSP